MTGSPAAQPDNSLTTAQQTPAEVAGWPPGSPAPALVGNRAWARAWARVIRRARCTDSSLDADEWFPVSPGAQQARREAAAAIAICRTCPVRSQCLALSLRYWDVGQHGVWGGLVAAERASLRQQMLAHRAGALRYLTDATGLPLRRQVFAEGS
jgi:Transcription factor WhiB